MLHGPYGEDGTIQGLLELANVPYVGAGVLASAVGMDKALMKLVFSARGLPVCPYRVVLRHEWTGDRERRRRPSSSARSASRCSSSRPTSDRASASRRPRIRASLEAAMDLAGSFDRKIVVEAAVAERARDRVRRARQRRAGGLGAGEVVPSREFYDYEAKYIDDGSKIYIPADLPAATAAEIQRLSIAAFQAIDCAGHGAGRLPAGARNGHDLRQRGEHHPRLHHDQHVLEALGRVRRRLPARCSID